MKINELAHKIREGSKASVYLLTGGEPFFLDEAAELIIRQNLGDNRENLTTFDGQGLTLGDLLDEVGTKSFFGDHKVVWVKAAQEFTQKHAEQLLRYLAAPCAETSLILTTPKLEKRSKAVKELLTRSAVVECEPLIGGQAVSWIKLRAEKKYAVTISQPASALLLDTVGNSLMMLDRELEKLSTFVRPGGTITPDEVHLLAVDSAILDAFKITDAAGAGDRARALSVLDKLLDSGEEALKVLGAITYQWRRLLRARRMVAAGVSVPETLNRVGVHYFQHEFENQLRNLKRPTLERGFRQLLQCDLGLKTSTAPPALLMERLLFSLCR